MAITESCWTRAAATYADTSSTDGNSDLDHSDGYDQKPFRARRNYNGVEVSLLRNVGRNRVPIVPLAEISLDCDLSHSLSNENNQLGGASMQVYRGQWNDTKVALKYMRAREPTGADRGVLREYQRAINDIDHEVSLMSYKPLCEHRNITKLLGISFDPVKPVLIVELAHQSFPDLRLFFNSNCNQNLSNVMPFELAAGLISDIADGLAALHSYSVIHADLKPENTLIFPDPGSPIGIVAKIADFGMSGVDSQVPFISDRGRIGRLGSLSNPRGGTPVWFAPECLEGTNVLQNESSRDIYSFGLIATYIALGGRHPKTYAEDLVRTKQSDSMVETAVQLLKSYCARPSIDKRLSQVVEIARSTLRLKPKDRIQSLNGIRRLLYDQ